jgi:HEAT repeat protein
MQQILLAPFLLAGCVTLLGPMPPVTAQSKPPTDEKAARVEFRAALIRTVRCQVIGVSSEYLQANAQKLLPWLIEFLSERDIRLQTTYALTEIGAAAVPSLTPLLDSGNPEVRLGAAQALWQIRKDAGAVLPTLEPFLRDKDASRRVEAVALIAGMQPKGEAAKRMIEPLIGMLAADGSLPDHAAVVLVNIGADAAGPVTDALSRLSPAGRLHAIHVLARMGPNAEKSAPALIALVGGADEAVARAAARALPALGAKGREAALPVLEKGLLGNGSPALKLACADAIWRFRPSCMRSWPTYELPAIIALLDAKEPADRREAVRQLGVAGGWATPAVPRLVKMLDEPEFRLDAARALLKIDPKQDGPAVAALAEIATKAPKNEKGIHSSETALVLLAEMGVRAKPALPKLHDALRETLNHPEWSADPYFYFEVFQKAGSAAEVIPVLIDSLGAKDPRTRLDAAGMLSDVGAPARAALDAAVADGRVPNNPEVTRLLKTLRAAK